MDQIEEQNIDNILADAEFNLEELPNVPISTNLPNVPLQNKTNSGKQKVLVTADTSQNSKCLLFNEKN